MSTVNLSNSTYVAWALDTGPANVAPLWKNSPWITGTWTGLNEDLSPNAIQADIDSRVSCLVRAFEIARSRLSDVQKNRGLHVFIAPEFYFHCKQGPYPNVRIGENTLLHYLQVKLEAALKDVSLLKNESWIFLNGSILTCSEPDFKSLLQSREAQRRLRDLNVLIKHLVTERGLKSAEDFVPRIPHIRGLSFVMHGQGLSEAEQAIGFLMNEYRADPLCIVRNRGLAFTLSANGITSTGYEKQNESAVDLTMGRLVHTRDEPQLDPGDMITEWVVGYASISIINGDKQVDATPLAARYTITTVPVAAGPVEVGVEICVDHRLQRLRRTVGMTVARGAAADNPRLDLQLIPSGGMQILDYAVSAGADGVVFNSDGCDPIVDAYTSEGKPIIEVSGTFRQITCGVYASSAQTMVQRGGKYYSHSQLSFRFGGELNGYDNALGTGKTEWRDLPRPASEEPRARQLPGRHTDPDHVQRRGQSIRRGVWGSAPLFPKLRSMAVKFSLPKADESEIGLPSHFAGRYGPYTMPKITWANSFAASAVRSANLRPSPPQRRKLARIVFHILSTRESYHESVFRKCEEEGRRRAEMRLRRQAAHLGFRIIRIAKARALARSVLILGRTLLWTSAGISFTSPT